MNSWALRHLKPFLAAALAAALGCVGQEPANGLYVFDNASHSVLVWSSLDELHAAARDNQAAPEPARRLRSAQLGRASLGWGGMAMDTIHQRLYLVTDRGVVYVILNPAHKNGDLRQRDDLISFRLRPSGSDGFPSDSTFGPVALDPASDVLYVMENARDAARVWHLARASQVRDGDSVGSQHNTSRAGNDQAGVALAAAPNHRFFALFGEGDATNDGRGRGTDGPRLRMGEHRGEHPAFPPRANNRDLHLLAGPATRLPEPLEYGSMVYDDHHHCLYVWTAPQPETRSQPGQEPPPEPGRKRIEVFTFNQFHGAPDQAPSRHLTHVPPDLRILAGPPRGDWLLGAASARPSARGEAAGQATLYLWKNPSEGGRAVTLRNLAAGAQIRGLAFGEH